MCSMCWPVYHIGDVGKHLEELEEGTSHRERDRDSILALCGGTSWEKHLDSLNVGTRGCFKTRPVPVRQHERKKGTASQPSMEDRTSAFGRDYSLNVSRRCHK